MSLTQSLPINKQSSERGRKPTHRATPEDMQGMKLPAQWISSVEKRQPKPSNAEGRILGSSSF